MKERTQRNIILYLFILLLLFPLLLQVTKHKEIRALKGAVVMAEKPTFTAKEWFSGEYQSRYEQYVNDRLEIRSWFVRIRNQIAYTFFNEAKARYVVRGKEGYLYEQNYIKAINGEDYLGSVVIKNRVDSLWQLQEQLAERNKTLIVLIAPGKGTYYQEFIPDDLLKSKTDSTNYKQYTKALGKAGINTIDYNAWFLQMKDTCDCILYPKYGIHWSHYGMLLATDSLIHYIEQKRSIQMPQLVVGKIKKSRTLKHYDYDIGSGMNLMFQMPSDPMCYPEFYFKGDSSAVKPKTLVCADSFYWLMFNIGFGNSSLDYGGFWFYNNSIYPDSFEKATTAKDLDMKEQLMQNDVVILMTTEANLHKFSWGFVKNALVALQ